MTVNRAFHFIFVIAVNNRWLVVSERLGTSCLTNICISRPTLSPLKKWKIGIFGRDSASTSCSWKEKSGLIIIYSNKRQKIIINILPIISNISFKMVEWKKSCFPCTCLSQTFLIIFRSLEIMITLVRLTKQSTTETTKNLCMCARLHHFIIANK